MSSQDLDAPVRPQPTLKRFLGTASNPLSLATGLLTGLVSVMFVWLVVADDPLGGEPVARLAIDKVQTSDPLQITDTGLTVREGSNPDEVLLTGDETAPDETAKPPLGNQPLDIQFDKLAAATIQVSQPLRSAPIDGLTERGTHGLLPQIGPDGKMPSKLYARPTTRDQADPDVAKIAILIGGMGLSASGTSIAINRLPEEIALAFAPYAGGLQKWVNKARQNGHEVMLQIPLEPFDYPSNDPGPHTLLSSLSPRDNIRRLEWLMSRFTGYFGVTNYMGAKFTSAADSVRPVFKQLNRRGLVYLEDGSSARSQSAKIARKTGLKATTADLIIDNTPSADAINAALAQLETMALERGIAVGVASGLPITVDRIIEWAATLKSKGIVLVPVSATIALRQNLT